ncbi:hypothetical protein [Mesorhizobium sp. YM1C-6-2]|jgi:hypothetical protein|uniref:hypothetical protein n=1 Tax=Mesorhizobium sp. YM1C-6-2 TaxID=1827501 RepID=UPI000EF17928|nr:hypothetical protein [Mesorhizobium sp. YM1C-6-2]RLP28243.1 hypothetical protein D8676_03610 [Mesorhizobium sp. YM1C-6-2]
MKTATGLAFAAVLLAACSTSGNSGASLDAVAEGAASQRPAASVGPESADANEGIPRATAAGTSPIKPEIQAAFCQDQVAFMQSVEPQFATAHPPVVAADGSTTIEVTVAKDGEGAKTFDCRLDASNRFTGVTTASIQGAL